VYELFRSSSLPELSLYDKKSKRRNYPSHSKAVDKGKEIHTVKRHDCFRGSKYENRVCVLLFCYVDEGNRRVF